MATAKEMAESMSEAEIRRALSHYQDAVERVRWGLIRVFSHHKLMPAVPLLVADLSVASLHEAAVEALGALGAGEAFEPLLAWLRKRPESALTILLPLARTGREKAREHIVPYLNHEMAVIRQAAARALESIRRESP
jgi:HEAT repeat protein